MAKKSSKTIVVDMSTDKVGKGSVRFRADADNETAKKSADNIYIKKEGLVDLGNPDKLRITIEPAE